MKKATYGLACTAALLLGTTAVSAQTPDNALIMAYNIDAISTFDPAQVAEAVTSEILMNTCEALVDFDPDEESEFIPALAESWDVSDDGLTITFTLKEGIVFPDGTPGTAGDLVWSMQRVVELGYGAAATLTEYGFTVDTIQEAITAPDDRTIVMQLDQPYPIGLILGSIAAHRVGFMLNRAVLEENEQDGDWGNAYLNTRTECVGPYSLARWDAGDVVILEANEHFTGEAPGLPRVMIRHVAETGTQRLLLERGDVDVARNLTPDDLTALAEIDGIEVEQVLRPSMFYLALDNTHEAFSNPLVRHALRYLIDYDGLADSVMQGVGIPRASYVQYGAFGALDEAEGQPFTLDIERAGELLAEAGYEDGFSATLLIGSHPYGAPIAQNLQENASQLGITFNIERMANAQLFARTRARDFEAAMLGFVASAPDAHAMSSRHVANPDNSFDAQLTQYPSWRSSYVSEEENAAVDEALLETDPERREQLYHEMQRRQMEDGPQVYIMQTIEAAAMLSTVQNWTWNGYRAYYNTATK